MYIAISNSIDTYNLIKIIPFNTPLFSNTYVAFFTFSQYDLTTAWYTSNQISLISLYKDIWNIIDKLRKKISGYWGKYFRKEINSIFFNYFLCLIRFLQRDVIFMGAKKQHININITYVAFFTFSQYDLFSVLHQLKSTNIQCNLYQNFALWVTTGCRSPSKEVCVCMVGWWCLNYILY
jgi:hypothetical protein